MAIPPKELETKSAERGDLLVCEGGEIGRAAAWDLEVAPMLFENHLHRLRPKRDDVIPRFYVYFLHSAFTQLGLFEGAGNKTTIANLSRSHLAALEVPRPERDQQLRIVNLLGLIREAIQGHQRRRDPVTYRCCPLRDHVPQQAQKLPGRGDHRGKVAKAGKNTGPRLRVAFVKPPYFFRFCIGYYELFLQLDATVSDVILRA